MFENLKAEMARNNKNIADIGKLLGISTNAVSFKLNGRTHFTLHEMLKLADTFHCSIDYLARRKLATIENY